MITGASALLLLSIGRHSQVVRQSSAKAPPPVRVWVSPPKRNTSRQAGVSFWIPGEFEMLGGSEFRLRQGFACGKTLVRRKSADPPCGAPVLSGIYSLRTRHKNNHTVRCGYFYGILRYFKCSGQVNCPCAKVLPAAKRLYGAKAPPRCAGPQSCPASILCGQDKNRQAPTGACRFLLFHSSLFTLH